MVRELHNHFLKDLKGLRTGLVTPTQELGLEGGLPRDSGASGGWAITGRSEGEV